MKTAGPAAGPGEVTEYLAEQLGIADPSCLKEYGERDGTARTHAGDFQEAGGWCDFAEVRDELSVWLDARAWTTGDGPKSLFDEAAGWLRERRVLLPGASRLARLVGSVREVANNRLWDTLYGLLSIGQRAVLDSLLSVPPGARCGSPGPDEVGAGAGAGDRGLRDGGGGRVRDTAAAAGGAVPVRHRWQGVAAQAAR
ncbi:hypothetical protein SHKM778_46480 [Streptomyces sp. KM77-8]|uniref:DUF4158 domain-containing protein n=1 Tax=Streptomyces haneummycinicus TaxID=3074435 RepID=A0AAT9HLN0_9ACTN